MLEIEDIYHNKLYNFLTIKFKEGYKLTIDKETFALTNNINDFVIFDYISNDATPVFRYDTFFENKKYYSDIFLECCYYHNKYLSLL